MRGYRFAVLLALAGCSSATSCPLVGCVSQLTVPLPGGATSGRACVEDVCTSTVVDGALLVPLSRRSEGTTTTVRVTLGDRSTTYEGEVDLVRTRPNGPSCPPVCVSGRAVVDLATGTVRTAR